MVFDTHTHAWGYPNKKHPWINGPLLDRINAFSVDTVYTAEKLLADMDRAGIDEAVIVGYPIFEWTDNWYTIRTVQEYDRLYGIVMLDPFADDSANHLREAMAVDDILGFRVGAACPYDRMWETFDPTTTWLEESINETEFWEVAAETNAIVQILADYRQLNQVSKLVETYPHLTYLLDHFAHADADTSASKEPFSPFEELIDYENIAVKVSEIQHRSREEFPYADMHDLVRWFLDEFGRERVIWGSDFPNVSDQATYGKARHWINHVDGVSATDHDWILETAFKQLANI